MAATGRLGALGLARARAERLALLPETRPFVAPHFVEHALAGVRGRSLARLETTLDADLQREVQGILRMHKARLDAAGARDVAVVVLKNDGAEWLAWEGSGAFADSDRDGSIDGVTTPRQPGSALKPFTYALAFERGASPASVLPDVPSFFPTAEKGVVYTPRNYDGVFRGPLRARASILRPLRKMRRSFAPANP
jgi:penicillin-binding protein 1C